MAHGHQFPGRALQLPQYQNLESLLYHVLYDDHVAELLVEQKDKEDGCPGSERTPTHELSAFSR